MARFRVRFRVTVKVRVRVYVRIWVKVCVRVWLGSGLPVPHRLPSSLMTMVLYSAQVADLTPLSMTLANVS